MAPHEAEQPPEGFSADEWDGWRRFAQSAREVADAIHCEYGAALLILGLNEIAMELGEIREMLNHRRGPDEPWKDE